MKPKDNFGFYFFFSDFPASKVALVSGYGLAPFLILTQIRGYLIQNWELFLENIKEISYTKGSCAAECTKGSSTKKC